MASGGVFLFPTAPISCQTLCNEDARDPAFFSQSYACPTDAPQLRGDVPSTSSTSTPSEMADERISGESEVGAGCPTDLGLGWPLRRGKVETLRVTSTGSKIRNHTANIDAQCQPQCGMSALISSSIGHGRLC
jgi:hypothetical protein